MKSNKNYFLDAEAIAEAVDRQNMRFVPIKTGDQLDLQALHSRMRSFTFGDADKIEEMARRGGPLKDLAGSQALETGIRNGAGPFRWF
nr:hypothetical protein [Terriglobus roseus]